jgi:hypothetical protein
MSLSNHWPKNNHLFSLLPFTAGTITVLITNSNPEPNEKGILGKVIASLKSDAGGVE